MYQFLNACNAAESFHRSVSPSQERWPKGEFEARIDNIISSVPNEDKEWLGEQLRYANEPRFRARLKEMFERQPDGVRHVLGDRKTFVEKVVTNA